MFCRAKISALLTLVGVLSASGAMLNPEQLNPVFQPGGNAKFAKPAILQPAGIIFTTKLWSGIKVQKITPGANPLVRVDLGGVTFTKTQNAVIIPGPVKKAGGAR